MAKIFMNPQDWQRILEPLFHFLHNRDFNKTYDRVERLLSDAEPD